MVQERGELGLFFSIRRESKIRLKNNTKPFLIMQAFLCFSSYLNVLDWIGLFRDVLISCLKNKISLSLIKFVICFGSWKISNSCKDFIGLDVTSSTIASISLFLCSHSRLEWLVITDLPHPYLLFFRRDTSPINISTFSRSDRSLPCNHHKKDIFYP